MMHDVSVVGLVRWAEPARLLGPGEWTFEGHTARASLPTHAAADLDARLRGLGVGGAAFAFSCRPPLPRAAVRAARTTDARRRREASPGFTRPGVQLDEEGRVSLTPEALALAVGQRVQGATVIDAGCGAGGNTIGFARAGCQVIAIERDASRLELARRNARVYGVAERVRWIHGAVESILPDLRADVLYLDPPWGVDWPRPRCTLADLPGAAALLPTALALAPGRVRQVLVKLPPSFDVRELPAGRPEAWFGVGRGDERRVKFVVLTIDVAAPGD